MSCTKDQEFVTFVDKRAHRAKPGITKKEHPLPFICMSENYFQFPISALSFGMFRESRWNDVLHLACWDYGRKAIEKTPHSVVTTEVEQYLVKHPECTGNSKLSDHRELLFGCSRLHVVKFGSIHNALSDARQVRDHCAATPYPLVRIRTDLWWKTFTPESDSAPISFREFAVLCAVYAGIGSKPYSKLSHKYLRIRAAGYVTWEDFIRNQKLTSPNSIFLSARQIRTTLDALEANHFFAKFTYNRGECFYSNKSTHSELSSMIEKRKLRKLETVAAYRSLDQATSKDIKARKMAASSPHSFAML